MGNTSRREFFEMLGIGAAATAWSGALRAAEARTTAPSVAATAEGLIRAAAAEDCLSLAMHSPTVCPAFKQCFQEYLEIVQLGGATPCRDSLVVSQLPRIREAWPAENEGKRIEEQLAFLLGSLCRLAADRNLGSAAGGVEEAGSARDRSLYRAAFVLREVCGDPDRAKFSANQIEGVLAAFWQRTLVRWHTFIPEGRDVEDWIARLSDAQQQIVDENQLFAKAFSDPDREKLEQFVVKANYYDPRDPVIRLARSLRDGRAGKEVEVERALAAASSRSRYGEAVRSGCRYLQAASAYFEHRATEQLLRESLSG